MAEETTVSSKQKDSKKNLILSTALKVFCEKGYNNTTIDDIAKKAGFSHGLIYHYYKGKKEIFDDVMQNKRNLDIKGLKQAVDNQDSYVEKLKIIAQSLFLNLKNDENCSYYFYLFISETFRKKDVKKPPNNDYGIHPIVLLENLFSEGQKKGELNDKYSPKECVELFMSIIQGATLGYVISPKEAQKRISLPKAEFISEIFAKRG